MKISPKVCANCAQFIRGADCINECTARGTNPGFYYQSHGNGLCVELFAPGGVTIFLQGDDAAKWLDDAEKIENNPSARYTVSDLISEYVQ